MSPSEQNSSGKLPRDLASRLASGLVLGGVALLLTWAGRGYFAGLVLVVSLLVAWEWGRIVRGEGLDVIFAISAIVIITAVILTVGGLPALALVSLVVGAILAALLGFEKLGRVSALGVFYAGFPAVALVWIRSATPGGFEAALFLLLTVWAADTGAYFSGRAIGGPKLMPKISPNKTWSGFLGGMLATVLVAVGFAIALPYLSAAKLIAMAVGITIVAQAGDLMESAMKRWHGVKDASGLIPGHGGFMDRVDGLIFVAVAAAIVATTINVHNPASALLMWR